MHPMNDNIATVEILMVMTEDQCRYLKQQESESIWHIEERGQSFNNTRAGNLSLRGNIFKVPL